MRLDAIQALDRLDSNKLDSNSIDNNIRLNNGSIEGLINISNDVNNSITRIHINDNHDSSIKSGKIEEEKPLLGITLNPLLALRIPPPSVAGLGSALPPLVVGLRSAPSPESLRPEKSPVDKRVYPDKDDSGITFESKSGSNHL
jgi:hypothetical protein